MVHICHGMWLLGKKTGNYDRAPDPALPIGWLLAIALRHIHTQPSTADPADAWKSAAELAIDFAASMDCQRYNLFDGLNLGASDFRNGPNKPDSFFAELSVLSRRVMPL